MVLMARMRSRLFCRALKTMPMPPRPNSARRSYSPKTPGASSFGCDVGDWRCTRVIACRAPETAGGDVGKLAGSDGEGECSIRWSHEAWTNLARYSGAASARRQDEPREFI